MSDGNPQSTEDQPIELHPLANHCNDTCKNGHDLYVWGSLQKGGDGYQFIQCRLCNSIRAKGWRRKRREG